MLMQFGTNSHIEGHDTLSAPIREVVNCALGHESDHLTGVKVHLPDEGGPKGDPKETCRVLEVRPMHYQAFSGAPVGQAINGLSGKPVRLVTRTQEKLLDVPRHRTEPPFVAAATLMQP